MGTNVDAELIVSRLRRGAGASVEVRRAAGGRRPYAERHADGRLAGRF